MTTMSTIGEVAGSLAAPTAAALASAPARPLLVLNLRGSQEEMGAQHGWLLREQGGYHASLHYYRDLPERLLFGTRGPLSSPLGLWLVGAVKEWLLGRLQLQRPPEYLARSRAFMRALGMPAEHARFLTVMDLFQNTVGVVGRLRLGPFARRTRTALTPACTTLAVWGQASAGEQLRHARNFDFPGIGVWDRAPAVVFCSPDRGLRYGFVTTRGADTPGITAFNEAGLVVTAHTRFHRDVSFDGAAIVDVGHDIARRAETIADAVAVARERRIASTWGLAVSSGRERKAVVIETTASQVEVVEAGPEGDYLSCANRYRHPDTRVGQLTASPAWGVHSDVRQQRICDLVAAGRSHGGLDVAGLEALLDDHFDPGDPETARGCGGVIGQGLTVKSIVAEPEVGAIHVSVGSAPTSRGPYLRVDWSWDDEVGARELRAPAPAARPVAPAVAAFDHFVEANRIAEVFGSVEGALPELERAVALCPDDPSYRFVAGVVRLARGADAAGAEATAVARNEWSHALDHFAHGLALERIEFRRGQLLLWGARAADLVGDTRRASRWRRELATLAAVELAEHRAAARAEQAKPYTWRKIEVSLLLADAQ